MKTSAKKTGLKIAKRLYECHECGNRVEIETNHKIECYPVCKGKCRQILNPHTAKEIVLSTQTTHKYIGESK